MASAYIALYIKLILEQGFTGLLQLLCVLNQLFDIRGRITYIHLPVMVSKEDAPAFFDKLNSFMKSAITNSQALIVDVRSNGGGTRDVTYGLAKYLFIPILFMR